jgi:hypothetical protein
MHHGQGGRKDETDKDAERYFRAVDRAVAEHYSKPTGLPLILAALSQHHDLFRRVSHNPLLVDTAIDAGPDALTPDQLRQRAWQTLEPQHLAQQARLAEAYGTAQAQDLGSDDLTSVVQAAVSGRVGVLFIEADRQIAGRLDLETGGVVAGELINPHVDYVLDDLATLVELMGGQVHVMQSGQIPGTTGLAAIYRN